MSTFNLEKRAAEILPWIGEPYTSSSARNLALQFATEALEAAAQECEDQSAKDKTYGLLYAASIIRSFIAKPGAQEERAPRIQSSPDASHGERVSADAPPASLSDSRSVFPSDELRKRTRAAWLQAIERHDARPASEVVAEIACDEIVRAAEQSAPLSDAEILSMAAEIVAPYDDAAEQHSNVSGALLELAAKLRAAEEVDVFEAFGRTAEEDDSGIPCGHSLTIAKDALRWFGPLVTALENIRDAHGQDEWNKAMARDALLALRERARESGSGR